MRLPLISAAALALLTLAPATAQTAIDCNGWQASAQNIPEPWSDFTRTYASGEIRVALLDTIEPAAGALYLLVLAPPYDELGGRNCAVIASGDGSIGFANADFGAQSATYNPATGLTVRLGVEIFAPATGGFDPAILAVTINQATGTIVPHYEIP